MFVAVDKCLMENVHFLLLNGFNPDIKNEEGDSALTIGKSNCAVYVSFFPTMVIGGEKNMFISYIGVIRSWGKVIHFFYSDDHLFIFVAFNLLQEQITE